MPWSTSDQAAEEASKTKSLVTFFGTLSVYKKYKKDGMIRDFATLLLGEFSAREPRLLGDFLMFHLEFTNNSDGPIVPRNRKQKELSLRHCVNPKCGTRGEA